MDATQTERVKLTATALNGVAVTTVGAGVVAPLVAPSYGVSGAGGGGFAVLVSIVWLSTGVALHLLARSVLGGLRG